jgi:phage N-6-adenine-methyltransferase
VASVDKKDQNASQPQPATGTDIHDAGTTPAVAGANGTPAQSQTIRATNKNQQTRHSLRVLTSSKKHDWATPDEWFEYLNLEFGFTLDPCSQHETACCKKHYTPEENGLAQSWADERVFMNPPYEEIKLWMKKAYEESMKGALVVCFVPARVDTDWWHRYAGKADEIRFPKGRVTFKGADAGAPFPIAIVIFRPRW